MRKLNVFIILVVLLASIYANASEKSGTPISEKTISFQKAEKIKVKTEQLEEMLKKPEFREQLQNRFKSGTNTLNKDDNSLQSYTNTKVTSGTRVESEIHAAINPKDSNNIVVSPIRQATTQGENAVTVPIYYTKDFGKTWKVSSFEALPPVANYYIMGGGDPVFAFDADGKCYFTWIHLYATISSQFQIDSLFAGLYCAESTDGGESWTFNGRTIAPLGKGKYFSQTQLNSMIDKQWMACDLSNSTYKNSLYVSGIYMDMENNTQAMKTYIKRGNNFNFETNPPSVDQNQYSTIQFGNIGVDQNGTLHYTFYANDGTNEYLIHTSSSNGGATWSNLHIISKLYGILLNSGSVTGINQTRLYPSPYLAVDNNPNSPYKGNLYMTWSSFGINSNTGTGLDVFLSYSTDSGLTWSAPHKLNKDDNTDAENYYPNITISPDGIVVVGWYDRSEYTNERTDYVISISKDGGKNFSSKKTASESPSNHNYIGNNNNEFGIGEYSGLVASKSYAIPFWSDGRTNDGYISIYTALVPLNEGDALVEQYGPINAGFTISNLYPNPAVNSTTLEFYIEKDNEYLIDILDVKGNIVTEFTKSFYKVGSNRLSIETKNISNGTYFVRLSDANNYIIRKLTVNK